MAGTAIKSNTKTVNEDSLDYVLNFQRREFKYYIAKSRMERIIPHLQQYMDFDPFSKKGYYPLYSIYFDTEDWQAYYEKMDGVERRKKFRIRTYSADPNSKAPIMLEVKEKNKDIILKRRTLIDRKDIIKVQTGQLVRKNDEVLDEWRYNIIRNSIKPKILIGYERLAFKPRNHGNIRVTIDRNVRHAMVSSGADFNAPLRETAFSKNNTVLEVKFKDHPPGFIIDLIRNYNLQNEAISKFCESVITNYKFII